MAPTLGLIGLEVRLSLRRLGWSNGIAALLCVAGGIGWLWGVPYWRARVVDEHQAFARVQALLQSSANAPSPVVQRSLAEEHVANFRATLGDVHLAEQQVKMLFAIARKVGLHLNQAEYKWALDKPGRYHTYQILLPVRGSYPMIRQFCEQTLLAIPFASLDEMTFKRDAIANATLEAKLRFTLYLADAPLKVHSPTP